ncbi:UDP-2,3-diacylglucosamine diphosphatase [Pelagicoccus sp. SDUM812003]|uniref:UDP-2,3-diacylglucosamine diphosphatase n=1 Tax=Pelagicoccus sp. SDUM812003 TaxID=3041267 RepID=UPI00280EEDDF|nr:UDP-2,3-diacylglucosamine diphosphatase [Pelagicoccus sp. SDUM812003]MDQ8204805.1 UDP-2,3-diacylglucosamine diphosphatase [Pelagicoccus sp. SDUM812003]
MKKPPLKYKSIFISDVHLGTLNCKVKEVLHFLKNTRCDRLVLNGDIIDGWQLGRGSRWTKDHTKFVRWVLKKVEKKQQEVIYLRGNHDDILSRFLPLQFSTVSIVEDYIHETPNGRYLVLHGDIFDTVTKNFTFLAHLGDWGYKMLMNINRWYNKYRAWRGKDYHSLSKAIKAKVKKAVNFISDFEEKLAKLAESRGCVGVICGHIHTPADKMFGDLHYLNSGDWVESLSAIVEHHDGRFELVHFADFALEYPMKSEDPNADDGGSEEDAYPIEIVTQALSEKSSA